MANTHDNLGYWCSDAVARDPDGVAMIDLCGDRERIVTYGELEQRLSRFGNPMVALRGNPVRRSFSSYGRKAPR